MSDSNAPAVDGEQHAEGEEPPPPGTRVMAIVRWGLVVALGIAAVLAWSRTGEPEPVPAASAALYTCPMDPQVIQDHPGSCPVCGMDLVPKALISGGSSDVAGLALVELGTERIQLLGMRTAKVRHEKLTPTLRVPGLVTVNEQKLARVAVRVGGWLESVVANQTGQTVERGQLLARLGSPEILAAERELLQLRNGSDPSLAPLVEDARRRLELLGVSAQEVAQVEKSGQANRTLDVRAPVAGVVTGRAAVEGLLVQPGTELFEITDLSTIWVVAQVPETELSRVHLGQRAKLELAAFAGRVLDGTVAFLAPSLDPQARTLAVRLEFKNPARLLRPGMSGTVTIALSSLDGLVAPSEAIVDTGDRRYAFVALGNGRFEPRLVRTGAREGDRVQVLEGLADGDDVVTTGNFLIDSESRLRAALAGHADAPAAHEQHPEPTP